ncbi:MAG TPA: acyclic terpene utilization AtuA family protein [Mycobacteriales bacterium]
MTTDPTRGGGRRETALRIGNASGFYGDRLSAVREMLTGGELDVLTGDYLAELTLLILGRARRKDPAKGYATTFLRQLEDALGLAVERGVTIVANAGGLNPAGLADAVRELASRLGLPVRVAHVEGDDLLPRTGELGLSTPEGTPLTANAYLGAWGIAEALRGGADVVVTGRVTDASLVVGPAAARFGWARDDWDTLAGATVAGHLLECGAHVTGGNFAFFTQVPDLRHPGFPIAEVRADGSATITKHPGTGGAVTVDTVTAQLLYEIGSPAYAGPDVTSHFDTVTLAPDGPDRVRVTGARGTPPPPEVKVCLTALGGFRNATTFVLTGLDIEAKASLVRSQLDAALGEGGPRELTWTLARTDHPDADTEETASALLHVVAKDSDPARAGRAFSGAAVELALASYPGFHVTAPPGDAAPYGVYRPGWVPQEAVEHTAVTADGTRVRVQPPPETAPLSVAPPAYPDLPPGGATRRVPLGTVCGARSGDKGGTANIGVWGRTEAAGRWLAGFLTPARVRDLLPEAADLPVTVYPLPNLCAVNIVVDGLLGEGVASSTRFDPQGKALGEWLRSRLVDVPVEVL